MAEIMLARRTVKLTDFDVRRLPLLVRLPAAAIGFIVVLFA